MTENEFILEDRLAKIRSMNEQYDLEHNAYISYSGGKDSTALSHIIDKAIPGNKIPRVFLNTGIEYQLVVAFVLREREGQTYSSRRANTRHTNYSKQFWIPVQKQRA